MASPLARARSVWALARLLDRRERVPFFARQAAGRRVVARYRRAGGRVAFHLRHATEDLQTLDQVLGESHYALPAPAVAALRALGRPPEVVDLGANIGLFGVEVLDAWPGAHVVAFEPDPANAAVLARSIAANPGLRWELVEAAAGVADGEATFAAGRFANSRIAGAGERGVTVPVRDAFAWLAGADYVKIDIEGAEWPLLADPRFAALPARVVALEYHAHGAPDGDPETQAERALRRAGFTTERGDLAAPEGHGMWWGWKAAASGVT
jgi:FkbM family methyltransferase